MHAGDNRALAWAALASLALHVLLVVGWLRMQERMRPAPSAPIVSRLAEPPSPQPPRAAEPARAAEPQPRPKPAVEKKPRAEKPIAKAIERAPQAQPAPVPASAPGEETVQPKPRAEPQAPAAVTAAPAAAPQAPAPPAQPQVDLPTTIAQYRMQVLGAARRLKGRYPDLARENNWSGSVVVALAVGADGAAEVKLKSGSGHAPLDEQASQMFRQAARAVPVPPALQGRAFSVELKAVYGLTD